MYRGLLSSLWFSTGPVDSESQPGSKLNRAMPRARERRPSQPMRRTLPAERNTPNIGHLVGEVNMRALRDSDAITAQWAILAWLVKPLCRWELPLSTPLIMFKHCGKTDKIAVSNLHVSPFAEVIYGLLYSCPAPKHNFTACQG